MESEAPKHQVGEEEVIDQHVSNDTLDLVMEALKVVAIPDVPKKLFTVSEDLTILKLFWECRKETIFNVRSASKKIADIMCRTSESVRQRYRKKLIKLSDAQLREMCGFLLDNRKDGSCEWKNGQMTEIHEFGKSSTKKQKSSSKKTHESSGTKASSCGKTDIIEIEETKEPSLMSLLNKATKEVTAIVEEEEPVGASLSQPPSLANLGDFNTSMMHELYCQPEEVLNAMFELADICGLHEIVIYDRLKACSMDLGSLEMYLNDPKTEPFVMWTADQDKMLVDLYTSKASLSLLTKFKGQERVQRRIRYLTNLGTIRSEPPE